MGRQFVPQKLQVVGLFKFIVLLPARSQVFVSMLVLRNWQGSAGHRAMQEKIIEGRYCAWALDTFSLVIAPRSRSRK